MKTMDIPKSTHDCIIIPCNKYGLGFKRNCYSEEFLSNIIEQEEFDKVIDHLTKFAQIAYSEKRKNDNKQLSNKVFLICLFCLFLVFIFFITSYLAAIEQRSWLRIISVVVLIIAIAIISIVAVSIIFAKMPSYPDLDTLVKNKLDSYFDKINPIYIQKGFYWRAVPHHYWIELRIEGKDIDPVEKQ